MSTQSDLIRNTLLPLSFRHRQDRLEDQFPSVLALLSYSPVGMEEGFQSIRSLRKEKVRLRIWVEQPLTNYFSMEELTKKTESDDIFVKPDYAGSSSITSAYLFLPILSYSLVSKVIHHDDGHPFSKMILESLFTGRKVGAIPIAADPYHPEWKDKGYDQATPFLKHEMKSRLMQLKGYGVELLDPRNVTAWINKSKEQTGGKKVISQENILQAHASQNFILDVDKQTIITPLARDMANELGVVIRLGDGPPD